MAKDILMPALSPSMTEGTLVKWIKKEGDAIKQGDVLAEVETDKATMDLEAFDAGILRKILIQGGEKVPINTRIGIIGAKDEAIDLSAPAKLEAAAAPPPKKEETKAPATATPVPASHAAPSGGSRIKASPLAKKIAKAEGINLAILTGSGPGGRIVKKDVLNAPANGRVAGGSSIHPRGPIAKEGVQKLSTMRSVIAKRLLESKTQIPHFYLEIEIDAKPLLDLRAQLNDALGKLNPPVKLSLNDFVLKAAAEAVRRVPSVNASFEGDSIRQFADVQLSFAVAIPEGLITPIIREAQNKSLLQINAEAKALAAKAREGKLKPEEFQGGTFTVSNLGMLGIDRFSAIINPPQAAILAVGNIVKKAVVGSNDEIIAGHRQSITLSCDHRVVDGAVGATYLKELRELLEKPALLLL
ncbi:MAG TPA: pyruvate dehydrogenase complex dihydrolipoamide acetyltransferase [Candidatus Methylacidiphilales bacterium]|nr:pyruvate dehydrogenase complex dihydrolipoamide acetyltransferase [Candidatus Methylacidiphilales bacterium]